MQTDESVSLKDPSITNAIKSVEIIQEQINSFLDSAPQKKINEQLDTIKSIKNDFENNQQIISDQYKNLRSKLPIINYKSLKFFEDFQKENNSLKLIIKESYDQLKKDKELYEAQDTNICNSYWTKEKYQKPMHPDDRALLEKRFQRIEQQTQKSIPNHFSSIFCWQTYTLKIKGATIKLTPTEKNICTAIFVNPSQKVYDLATIENAVYGDIASASEKLKQALKRINEKVKKVNGSKLFSYNEGLLNVLI